MSTKDDDIAAARRAVRHVGQAATAVARHYGDSVDLRRLQSDVARLDEDLVLLCGRESPPQQVAPQPREVIADGDYAPDFWLDAQDEGLGGSDRRTR